MIAVAVATVSLIALGSPAAVAAGRAAESTPQAWDKQVAPIAARVSKLRGLTFDHPVPVHYLSDAAFRKRVGVKASKLTKTDRRQVADLQSTLRAFGLIDANTDLVKSLDAVSEAGVLAFYDPKAKDIVIRGTGPLDVDRKATLAHELTHVLQDQHFDLQELRHAATASKTSSSGALTALIEGDAERIKTAYLKGLSRADRAAYDAAEAKTGDSVASEIESAPELVKVEFSAPYLFGPSVLDVLTAHGGNHAVDAALQRGAPTDKIYLDPAEALGDPKATAVAAPPIPKGAHRVGKSDVIGAFDLFTLLASRIDRQAALAAADAWTGDRVVTYRSEGRVCGRATIASAAAGTGALTGALRTWAAAMPDATVATGPGPRRTTVTTCAAGTIAAPSSDKIEGALRLLAVRNSIFASAVHGGVPTSIGECVSHRIVKEPILASSIDQDAAPSADVQRQLQQLAIALTGECRSAGRS
ncbi:MAG TPA: hypothetical protein VGN59_01055 [Acidimicrobiia bacterium]